MGLVVAQRTTEEATLEGCRGQQRLWNPAQESSQETAVVVVHCSVSCLWKLCVAAVLCLVMRI